MLQNNSPVIDKLNLSFPIPTGNSHRTINPHAGPPKRKKKKSLETRSEEGKKSHHTIPAARISENTTARTVTQPSDVASYSCCCCYVPWDRRQRPSILNNGTTKIQGLDIHAVPYAHVRGVILTRLNRSLALLPTHSTFSSLLPPSAANVVLTPKSRAVQTV